MCWGTPYVAYKDSTGYLTVKKWNGSAWALVRSRHFLRDHGGLRDAQGL